jgi:5-methylcytosine-specific restriction endonuclease McrA
MRAFSLAHLCDAVLLRDLADLVVQNRAMNASLLAYIAEVDARRLYLAAGFPSMYAYCVDELRLSEDAAYKRIQAARAAREFPVLFTAVAEGRLHLSAVRLLAPHLTAENVDDLVAAATHLRYSEIEQLLARRFPRPEMLGIDLISRLPASPLAAGQVEKNGHGDQLAMRQVGSEGPPVVLAARQVGSPASRVAALSAERFSLQVTIDRRTRDKLEYAQTLLSHSLPSGDVAQVLDRALDALIGQLEKRKFAATEKPRQPRPSQRRRHIPAPVRRAVWERDRGQCTFTSESGRRCRSRRFLEFDHADPVARGGKAPVERMRLRCRAHNQFDAERAFGVGFMKEKREAAQRQTTHREAAKSRDDHSNDILAGLRNLGVRADVARRATEFSASLQGATLEERMRAVLKFLGPKTAQVPVGVPG